MDAFQCFVFTFFIIPIVLFVFWNNHKVALREQRWRDLYLELGQNASWTAEKRLETARFVYHVTEEGLRFEVDWVELNQRYFLQVRHQLASTNDLTVDEQYRFGVLDRILGPDEQLGDTAFDDAVEIEGDEVRVTAMMNSRARETLKEAVAEGMTIQDGRLELVKESSFDLKTETHEMLQQVVRTALVLSCPANDLVTQLVQNAQGEQLPGVRARNLGMLLLHYKEHAAVRPILETYGEAFHENRQQEPLTALEEQAWVRELSGDEDRVIAVIAMLGHRGCLPASMTALRAYATFPEKDYRWRLAHQSIDAIQARIGPIEVGVLSLVDQPSGALSEALDEAGAVSVVSANDADE